MTLGTNYALESEASAEIDRSVCAHPVGCAVGSPTLSFPELHDGQLIKGNRNGELSPSPPNERTIYLGLGPDPD